MRLPEPGDCRPQLLLVDDEPANLAVLREVLQSEYRLLFARDGARAIQVAQREQPALVLLDVMMPDMSGLDTCRRLKEDPGTAAIPIIFVTALDDEHHEAQGLAAGAVDYVGKPVSPPIVRARVRTHLSLVRVEEVRRSRLEILQRLGRAAEFKDNETGMHIMRMGQYAKLLAQAAGYPADVADELLHASAMHDIGKIGIPDAILQKPGPLSPEEWVVMRRHPEMGVAILGDDNSRLLQLARNIALTHHEKWDGSGYPRGLSGEAIPPEGRIVAVADIFDALTSRRPYKDAWSVERAVDYLREQSGRGLDPNLVPLFLERMDQVRQIMARWAD